jgi:hypothetical protein
MNCFSYKSIPLIKRVFTSTVRPGLEYAALIWRPSSALQLNKLERFLRMVTKFGNLSKLSYEGRCSKLDLVSFKQRLARTDLIQFYRYQHDLHQDFIQFPTLLHMDRRTGGAHKHFDNKLSSFCTKKCFPNRVISSWNKLPNVELREVKSEVEFKKLVDSFSIISRL